MNGVTTIAKDNMRDLAFSVTGAPSFDDGEVTVTVRITSEDGDKKMLKSLLNLLEAY